MAFVLKKVSSYKWPVAVDVPVDGGKFKKETFTAIFRKMSRSAFNDLIEQGDLKCCQPTGSWKTKMGTKSFTAKKHKLSCLTIHTFYVV